MAKFIQKNNTGTLFLNERKTETSHPDYTGKAIINNKPFWVSAWIKISKKGTKYISIGIQEPFKQMKQKPAEVVCTNVEEVETYETTQETFDEGYGEPQQDDFNKQIDNFQQKHKTTEEDDEEIPF